MNKKKLFPLILTIVIGFCSVGAVVLAQQAEQEVQNDDQDVVEQESVPQEVESVEQDINQEPVQQEVQEAELAPTQKVVGVVSNSVVADGTEVIYSTEERILSLSPDKKYVAVTILGNETGSNTHIEDIYGKVIVLPHAGYAVTWSPDSFMVLLYLSTEETGADREIYSLSLDGTYKNFGLPSGVVGLDISSKGEIVYSLTDSRTDDSDIYIRNTDGKDIFLEKGNKTIFAWFRWSPDGSKFAAFKADLALSPESKELWIFEPKTSVKQKVSNVAWAYPPVWSSDGSRVLFSNRGQIWEYSAPTAELLQITKFERASAMHPTYTASGAVVFSDGKQIWSASKGDVKQVTSGGKNKLFPLAL